MAAVGGGQLITFWGRRTAVYLLTVRAGEHSLYNIIRGCRSYRERMS